MEEIESIRDILGGRDLEIYDSAFEEATAKFVSDFANVVMDKLSENDISPEDAVEKVVALKEYRGPVLEEVMRRLAKKE